MIFNHLVEMGGFVLNHHWHGINVLSLLECALLAAVLCSLLALFVLRKSRRLAALSLAGALSFATAAYAANTALSALTASGALAGANLIYVVQTAGSGGVKATMTQVATFINSLFSGDATVTSGGAVTVTKTNGTAFGSLATVTPGTGVATLLAGASSGTGGPAGTTSPTFTTPALGTPSALVGTNITGTGAGFTAGNVTTNANLTGMVTSVGNAASLGSFTSANLSGALTDETGTGSAVFGTAPTMSSPTINTAMTLGFLTGAGTECMQVSNTGVVSGTGSACGGSGSTGANPTATAGPTAVNGSATTFMRSDGAPAVQKASNSVFGIVEVDNTTITAAAGVISAVNNGTVTSVAAGCGTSTGGSAITTTGTVTAALTARTNTATSGVGADFVSTDCGGIVYDNSASSIASVLPVATTSGFGANTFFARCNINAGVVTITPTTSTIGGAATLVVGAGTAAKPTCVFFRSDGTNYSLTETPLGTAATQNTGTSGSTIPLLNGNNTSSGNNTHSGSETFTEVVGGGRTVSGTTDTLAATDCGTTVTYSNAGAVTVTVPQGLPSFCVIALIQLGAGKVSTNGSAVTPATQHAAGSFTGTRAQFSVINITNYTTNTVILSGDAS